MSYFHGLVFLTMFLAVSLAARHRHPGEGFDALGYPANITDLSRMSEGKAIVSHRSSIAKIDSVDCLRGGEPTESCNIAGGFCVDRSADCPGSVTRRACRTKGCKCCMPNCLSDCRPVRSCSNADGYCVKNDTDCHGVIDQFGCRGAGCKCCLPSDYDLPWVYLNYNLPWEYVGGDAFVSFNDTMSWYNAQTLCRSYGLNLYHPHDIIAVSEYLSNKTINQTSLNGYWHWLGVRGDNFNQVWFNGQGLSLADPWYIPSKFYNNGTIDCLILVTWGEYWTNGTVIGAPIDSCTDRDDINPLCG